MALLTWSDQYSVGVNELDHQHQKLMDILNHLHEKTLAEAPKEVIETLAKQLEEYTLRHFAAEEGLMARANYPHADDHHKQHVVLLEQIERFRKFYSSGDIPVSAEVLDFLRDWLANHILEEDKEYEPWLTKNGVA
jgi:hemerythrin-like metal-binding protein